MWPQKSPSCDDRIVRYDIANPSSQQDDFQASRSLLSGQSLERCSKQDLREDSAEPARFCLYFVIRVAKCHAFPVLFEKYCLAYCAQP